MWYVDAECVLVNNTSFHKNPVQYTKYTRVTDVRHNERGNDDGLSEQHLYNHT
jgi:hypothetical protein